MRERERKREIKTTEERDGERWGARAVSPVSRTKRPPVLILSARVKHRGAPPLTGGHYVARPTLIRAGEAPPCYLLRYPQLHYLPHLCSAYSSEEIVH